MTNVNDSGVLLVQALYPFTGKNNDELCFKKGDLIVVTQKEEGGWWEGTLNDVTGWFPSNYVKEHKINEGGTTTLSDIDSPPLSPQQTQQQVVYRAMVSKEIVESERTHVNELKGIYSKYLSPLQASDILSEAEFSQLIGNLDDIISLHSRMLALIEEQVELSPKEQRIGGTFLKIAPILQNAHKTYIGNHPKAVCVIEKYKDELNAFMERHGAARPGTLVLTTALSQPFRRLDKYPGMLQEFHRHIEESHPDRGDTQRSAHVFRELVCICSSIRRQKQLELEVLTNKVHGWEGGESLSVLGDILHMRSVALLPDNRDRYLVLFPSCLVILALSSRASSFIFEGKYSLGAISVNRLDDTSQYKNAFEITGNYVNSIVAICQSPTDQQQWVDILSHHIQNAKSGLNSHKNVATYGTPPILPAHHSNLSLREINIVSPPYTILTKYFSNLYHRKVITKELLRFLSGVVEDKREASKVTLRTHRSECSLQLECDSNNATSHSSPHLTNSVRRRRRIGNATDLGTPIPQRKEYKSRFRGNLQKWKHRPLIFDDNDEVLRKPVKEEVIDSRSSSEEICSNNSSYERDSFSQSHHLEVPKLMGHCEKEVSYDYTHHKCNENKALQSKHSRKTKQPSSDSNVLSVQSIKGGTSSYLTHSISKSLPFLVLSSRENTDSSSEENVVVNNVESSILSIPAPTIVISDYVSCDSIEESSSSHNICNKTIYSSPSSETLCQSTEENQTFLKNNYSTNPRTPLVYYFSSCSGDDNIPSSDYYELHRKQCFTKPPMSKSEPDIHYISDSKVESKFNDSTPKYESHFVRVVKDIIPENKGCKCESHSLRSSDSGLADIVNCSECCLQRGDTPLGLGRASPSFRSSRCSHSSFLRLGRYVSSPFRLTTPEVASECDSLFHTSTPPTPSCTPCTSAPLSCVSDSSVSLLEATSLVSPYPETEAVYRSGLYAHWWMKASICPKTINASRGQNLLNQTAAKPEIPPKPLSLKASCHPLRRSRFRGRRGVFPTISIPVLENPETENDSVNLKTPESSIEKLHMFHLDPESNVLCRDPSFESQGSQFSQVTVIQNSYPNRINSKQDTLNTNEFSPQISINSENNGLSDISSMHSFNDSEEGAGEMSVSKDPAEDFLVTLGKKDSLDSEHHPGTAVGQIYCSTMNLTLPSSSHCTACETTLLPTRIVVPDAPSSMLEFPKKVVHNQSPSLMPRSKSLPQSHFGTASKGSVLPVPPHSASPSHTNGKLKTKPWSLSCLRPTPPLRPGFSIREDKKNPNRLKKKDDTWHEDDALILKVIEYYCTSAKARYTVNSSLVDNPQVIVAADEKIIVEETRGNQVVLEEKSLVDTVYALKDQFASMAQDYQELRNEFEREKKLTQNLRNIIDQLLPVTKDSITVNAVSNL